MESEEEEKKNITTVPEIEEIVKQELSMDMNKNSSRPRMKSLFTPYFSCLQRNGLNWVLKGSLTLAVKHIVGVVRPKSLQQRLETDLELVHALLRKCFKGFMQHAMSVAEAFQIVDNGPPSRTKTSNSKRGINQGTEVNSDVSSKLSASDNLKRTPSRREMQASQLPTPSMQSRIGSTVDRWWWKSLRRWEANSQTCACCEESGRWTRTHHKIPQSRWE